MKKKLKMTHRRDPYPDMLPGSASPNASGLLVLPGVMLRKKQVVPPLAAALKESIAATQRL